MANVFFAISQPAGAIPELGVVPGNPTNPIGTGIIVAAASTAAAQVELRVNVPATGGANAGTNAALTRDGMLTAAEVIKALERFKNFLRQRGYISGSGGPTGPTPLILP